MTQLAEAREIGIEAGERAAWALREELITWPKPGLVSPVDSGSHDDMDAGHFEASIGSLRGYFAAIHAAGQRAAGIAELRALGIAAEERMLRATGGVNTHRGAIFSLGFLLAADGLRRTAPSLGGASLGGVVRSVWGPEIAVVPAEGTSNGLKVSRRYGVGGARIEAAAGFPAVYEVGLPALRSAREAGWNAAKVQCFFALVARLDDTNLLHRGGPTGLEFAQGQAGEFLDRGGVFQPGWQRAAADVHRAFVGRRLSPGGAGDLLAATVLVDHLEPE